MDKLSPQRAQAIELSVALSVLLILSVYTIGVFAAAPYSGFYFRPADGNVDAVFLQAGEPPLQTGDKIKRIGDITLEQYKADRRLVFFKGAETGDIFEIEVERNGQPLLIAWTFPGFNQPEFAGRLSNIWVLPFAFWLVGFVTQVTIRPRDLKRRLFVASNYLIALWLSFGAMSAWHLWESSTLLHAVTWIMMPVLLHFHWVFPHPLGRSSGAFWRVVYYITPLFVIGEFLHLLPRSLYQLPFVIALLGSIILLIVHFIKQKEARGTLLLLLLSVFVSFSLSIVFGIGLVFNQIVDFGPIAPLTFLSMPFMPLAYFYIIYRRQLGGLEARVNRLVSFYAFLILLGIVLFVLFLPFAQLPLNEIWALLAAGIALAASLMTAIFLPRFQGFVERRFFGIKLPYRKIQETYSERITTSTSINNLLHLLEDEVFPSLLVRQYAFLLVTNGKLGPLLTKNLPNEKSLDAFTMDDLTARSGMYIPVDSSNGEWMRLILPLKVGGSTLGFWLLGRRDPDDLYHQTEIPILRSLANQTAIALSSILRAEQLRKMYQMNVERSEQERMHLALELHDSILNQLAILRNNIDEDSSTPKFQAAYSELTRRLREIVSDLRPPMLMYGLQPAITELADNLMERTNDKVKVKVEVQTGEERIPEQMELHLFRIVQEACENALRHAQADVIAICGTLTPELVELTIEDNGIGIDGEVPTDLNILVNSSHFGIAGMLERARLIGAEIEICPGQNGGTRIQVMWRGER